MENNNQPQKRRSHIAIFFDNLTYRLSYGPALGFVCVMSVVTFLGMLFFINMRKMNADNLDIANSSLVLIIFFAVFFVVFVLLMISSIILNIIRRKQGKR